MGMHVRQRRPAGDAGQPDVQARREPQVHRAQDDTGKMQEALVAFATELSQGNKQPDQGRALRRHHGRRRRRVPEGPERHAAAARPRVHGQGRRRRAATRAARTSSWARRSGRRTRRPRAAALVAGVLRDGDWNIAQKWLGDNGICEQPRREDLRPGRAQLGRRASDYIDAAQKYIAGYCEDRPVVQERQADRRDEARLRQRRRHLDAGRRERRPRRRAAWSRSSPPSEYSSQMPNVIIGIDKWMKEQPRARSRACSRRSSRAATPVKDDPSALPRGRGDQRRRLPRRAPTPRTGRSTSRACSRERQAGHAGRARRLVREQPRRRQLTCSALAPGSPNLFAATYTVFGDIVVSQYPKLMPRYASAGEILDTSYLQDIMKKANLSSSQLANAKPVYPAAAQPVKTAISRRSWILHSPDLTRLTQS